VSRYLLVPYEQASDPVRALYDDYLCSTGATTVPLWVQSLGASADRLNAYWQRTKGSLLCGVLPMILKEMVVFVVSVENGSRYCSACHAHAVLNLDPTLKYEQLSALSRRGDAGADLPQAFRAALDYAIAVARDPNAVTDADFMQLQDAGFSGDEIHELQSVIDLAMMFNSYTSALQLPLDPEYRAVL
jgi:alkylhydroperoxidase family enzyme